MNAEQPRDEKNLPRTETEPKGEIITTYTEEYRDRVKELFRLWQTEDLDAREKGEEPTGSANPNFEKLIGDYLIALDEQQNVIGTIGIENCKNGIGYLRGMYVMKEFRGTDVATRLMQTMIESAKNQNYEKLFSATMPNNKRVHKFNTNNGFHVIETPPPIDKNFNAGTVFFEMDLKDEAKK